VSAHPGAHQNTRATPPWNAFRGDNSIAMIKNTPTVVPRGKAAHYSPRPAPPGVCEIMYRCDEVSVLDLRTKLQCRFSIQIVYQPDVLLLRKSSFEEYLSTFRNVETTCEDMSAAIAQNLMLFLRPFSIRVSVAHNPTNLQDGVYMEAESYLSAPATNTENKSK